MTNRTQHLSHAQALLTGIHAQPDAYLPRRAILVDWLDGFVVRATSAHYVLGVTEADDLGALADFLRSKDIAIAA